MPAAVVAMLEGHGIGDEVGRGALSVRAGDDDSRVEQFAEMGDELRIDRQTYFAGQGAAAAVQDGAVAPAGDAGGRGGDVGGDAHVSSCRDGAYCWLAAAERARLRGAGVMRLRGA